VSEQPQARFTPLGRLISILMIAGLIAAGVYMIRGGSGRSSGDGKAGPGGSADSSSKAPSGPAPEVQEAQLEVPALDAAAPYTPKDNTLEVEISEYAGYAGLIAANGGLAPSENSLFFKNHGFKVKLSVSEEESWGKLNSGKIAASVTTADVVAVYGRQFQITVPAQIGYSRGADGLVVRNEIKKINDLKGKIIATGQFTEVDFFLRYLAQEAGLEVNMLGSLDATPASDRVNVVYTEEGFAAGDLFLDDVKSGRNKLAGCVTWEPKVSEVVRQAGGVAHVLTSNRNLLVIADILVVNKGFAQANPQMVAGLVQGLLEGNKMVRDNQDASIDVVAKAFKWTREQARGELLKVHLSNLPENLAFFSGAIDAAGSFGGIYQSAALAYGSDLVKDPPDPSRFVDLKALEGLQKAGLFKDQKIAIAPIRTGGSGGSTVETNPLLSKDIRFMFEPNSADLDMQNQANMTNLESIKKLLQVSPGSTVLLRGHVDNALVEEFRRRGGEGYVRQQALRAIELSRKRAAEIKRLLVEKYNVAPDRLDVVGRGWEEPAGSDSDKNRRVEVQWFTIE
jgi:NitT/TauT family transport system substrate-binding protein